MKSAQTKYILILVLIFGSLIAMELGKPKPINWKKTYSAKDKIPHGSYIVFNELQKLQKNPIKLQKEALYEFLDEAEEIAQEKSNLVVIQSGGFIDKYDWEKLEEYAKRGNCAYLAVSNISYEVLEKVGVFINEHEEDPFSNGDDTLLYSKLITESTKNTPVSVHRYRNSYNYFAIEEDADNIAVIGVANNKPDFIVYNCGKGKIFLHANQHHYSNIHLLEKNNYQYTFTALSFLPPNRTLFWDEHYKIRSEVETIETQTPLKYILTQPAFSWAYYTLLVGLLLFFIFRAKRRQRSIPIIKKLANTSLEFTETIGRLYFNKGDHLDIANKKIQYLVQHIYSRYTLRFATSDPSFVKSLTEKSGVRENDVKYLVWKIAAIQKKTSLTADELWEINKKIDEFYKKAK